jgi:Xaa-Pro dipeptidase
MQTNKSSVMHSSFYEARQTHLVERLISAGIDALVLNPGPSLTYLTGLHFHLMERPVAVVFTPGQPITIILPELETAKLTGLPFPVQSFAFNDDPSTWQDVYLQAVHATRIEHGCIGVEPTRFRVLELRFLEAAAPDAKIISAENTVASLRMCKDNVEISAIRNAVDIAQRALQAMLPIIHIGMTEQDISAELIQQLLRAGTHADMAFSPIVSGGPNSANPHAFPSTRAIASGDLLVIDWGASFNGYISDLTRTFAIGAIEPELRKIYETVKQANAAGRAAGRPGIPAGDVDQAARSVIESAGYGKYFTHRTGHGIGMEGHEEPYMRAANPLVLAPGMAYTVEPGIYLPNYNGVRIEDDVIITEDGAESLSDFSRDLLVIG